MTTLDALPLIIALGAGGIIVVMLAVAFPSRHVEPMDEPIDDDATRAAPSRLPRSQVTVRRSGPMPGLRDAPSRLATPEARTTRAWKRPRGPTWRDLTNASTAWRHKLSDDLLHFRAWVRRREDAGWVATTVALSLALGYLVVHI